MNTHLKAMPKLQGTDLFSRVVKETRENAVEPNKSNSSVDEHFPTLDADEALENLAVLPSLCVNCEKEGETRMLTTKIPHFKEVIIASFKCEHCNYSNNQIEPAAEMCDKGCIITLSIDANNEEGTKADLNRQVVRSAFSVIKIPAIEFEMPPSREKKGEISTIEGIFTHIADSLQATYIVKPPEGITPEVMLKLVGIIGKLRAFSLGEESVEIIIRDATGNSFIENPNLPNEDPRINITYFNRTKEETLAMGYKWKDEDEQEKEAKLEGENHDNAIKASEVGKEMEGKLDTYFNLSERQAELPGECGSCGQPNITRMCITEIPHFKDIVIFCTQCLHCGYKNSEIKPGGGISPKGLKVTLRVTHIDDMKRDILKSDTAAILIPELDLELCYGTLGGKYTTITGILENIKTQLMGTNTFNVGDSAQEDAKNQMSKFMLNFDKILSVEKPFTFILDDPMGNVFIYNPHYPEKDPHLTIEQYERTAEHNSIFGLDEMKVTNYNPEMKHIEEEEGEGGEDENNIAPQNINVVDHPHDFTPPTITTLPQTIYSQEQQAEREQQAELEREKHIAFYGPAKNKKN